MQFYGIDCINKYLLPLALAVVTPNISAHSVLLHGIIFQFDNCIPFSEVLGVGTSYPSSNTYVWLNKPYVICLFQGRWYLVQQCTHDYVHMQYAHTACYRRMWHKLTGRDGNINLTMSTMKTLISYVIMNGISSVSRTCLKIMPYVPV